MEDSEYGDRVPKHNFHGTSRLFGLLFLLFIKAAIAAFWDYRRITNSYIYEDNINSRDYLLGVISPI
jgi:hypothetical protein